MSSTKRLDEVILTCYPNESWTNATFAQRICDALNDSVVTLILTPNASSTRWLLPDCLFNYIISPTSNFQGLIASQVIWKGANSTFPTPFSRLPFRMSDIDITDGVLLSYDDTPFTSPTKPMDWTILAPFTSQIIFFGLKSCNIYGSLPASLPITLCFFYMDGNHLTGSIPTNIYQDSNNGQCESFAFSITSNAITGIIPTGTFDNFLYPADPSNAPSYVSILMGGNQLNGPIPAAFYCPTPINRSLISIHLDVSYNQLTGTIPSGPFATCNLTKTTHAIWTLSRNFLSGNIPSSLMSPSATPNMITWTFVVASNPLTGSIPDGFFESLKIADSSSSVDSPNDLTPDSTSPSPPLASAPNNPSSPVSPPSGSSFGSQSSVVVLRVILTDTGLTGTVTVPDLSSRTTSTSSFRLYLNISFSPNLTRLNLDDKSGSFLQNLYASNSPKLEGTIPSSFFNASNSVSTDFDVSNTLFSGKMPDMQANGPLRLASLAMKGTKVDFCSGNRSPWIAPPSLSSCDLTSTNASYCSGIYPTQCSITSLGTVTTCASSSPPSPSFICINGVWTSVGSVDTPTLTVPSGASTTVVVGNLTSTTVVIGGAGSTVIVTGCITNLTYIELLLTSDDLKTIGKTKTQILVSSDDASCGTDLSNTTISLRVQGNTCKRATVKSQTTGGGTLSGIFSVDSSRCNTWWIILVSVIAGVVVLLAIIAALLVAFVPAVRRKVRPYHKRPTPKEAS